MKRKCCAIGGSICAVFLIILASLTPVVGYRTVQTSSKSSIHDELSQRLLFQTLCDIANNKEIQGIVLKSLISDGMSSKQDNPDGTVKQLGQVCSIGQFLSRWIRASRMPSAIGNNRFDVRELQGKIFAVIEANATLSGEVSQLSTLNITHPILAILAIFLILIWAGVMLSVLVVLVLSEISAFLSFTLYLLADKIQEQTGVWIFGENFSFFLSIWQLVSLAGIVICCVLIWLLLLAPIPPP